MSIRHRSTHQEGYLPSHDSLINPYKSSYRSDFNDSDLTSKTIRQLTRLVKQNWQSSTLAIFIIFGFLYFQSSGTEPAAVVTDASESTSTNPVKDAPMDMNLLNDAFHLPMDSSKFDFHYPPPLGGMGLSEAQRRQVWVSRSKAVARAFSHAWEGYVDNAWGSDILNPNTKKGEQTEKLGLTILDAMDAAWLMNKSIYNKAREWIVDQKGHFQTYADNTKSVAKVTSHVLGGLLAAYHLTGDIALLQQAITVADRIMPAFESSRHAIPFNFIDFQSGQPIFVPLHSTTSSYTSLQLEFKYLSHETGDPKYWNAVQSITNTLLHHPTDKTKRFDHLVPSHINPYQPDYFINSNFTLAKESYSFYEHLAKQHLQTRSSEHFFQHQYRLAFRKGIKKHLLMRSYPSNLLYPRGIVGAFREGTKSDKFDISSCDLAAVLAVTATQGKRAPRNPSGRRKQLDASGMEELYVAEELAHTCFQMYSQTLTGLAPDSVKWNPATDALGAAKSLQRTLSRFQNAKKSFVAHGLFEPAHVPVALEDVNVISEKKYNLDFGVAEGEEQTSLRPEAIEAFFVLYRVTGDEKYREWGWRIFRAIEQWAKVPTGGYSGLKNVNVVPPLQNDKMESFVMGETFKYLYLLFSETSILPLDEIVLNSNGHALPVFTVRPDMKQKLLWIH